MPFPCPRCKQAADERFYGPCSTCRTDLRRVLHRDARDVDREAYEPTMHVTPNAVAQRDD